MLKNDDYVAQSSGAVYKELLLLVISIGPCLARPDPSPSGQGQMGRARPNGPNRPIFFFWFVKCVFLKIITINYVITAHKR